MLLELQKKHDLELDQLRQDFQYQLEQYKREVSGKIDELKAMF